MISRSSKGPDVCARLHPDLALFVRQFIPSTLQEVVERAQICELIIVHNLAVCGPAAFYNIASNMIVVSLQLVQVIPPPAPRVTTQPPPMECSSMDYQKRMEHLLDRTRPTTTPRNKMNDYMDTDKSEKQETIETINSLVKANSENKALKKTLLKEAQKHKNKRLKNEHKKDTLNNCEIMDDSEKPLGDV